MKQTAATEKTRPSGQAAPMSRAGIGKTQRAALRPRNRAAALLFAVLLSGALLACGFLYAPAAEARGYPVISVRVILPFAKDDQQNLFISLLRPRLEAASDRDFLVNHVPGRGGGYAWRELSGKDAKGYDLALFSLPSFLFQSMGKNAPFDADAIMPVCILAYLPCALWVPEESPLRSLDDLIQLGRQGEALLVSGTGSYTDQHMANLIFSRAAGIPLRYLPYAGSGEAAAATLDKTALACWGYALPPETMPGMRALAVAAEARSPALPDVPTFLELDRDVLYGQYIGIAMPRTEDEYVAGLVADFFTSQLENEDLRQELAKTGHTIFPVSFAELPPVLERMKAEAEDLSQEYSLFPR